MKILVDYREGAKTERAGKGEYVRQIVSEMIKDSSVELVLLIHTGQKVDLPSGNWKAKAFNGGPWLWHILVVMWCEIFNPADLYFATTSAIVPALLLHIPTIMTIFDFTVWRYPNTHFSKAVRLEKIFMSLAIKRSKHLLAISNFSKQEAVKLFHVSASKITTILLGVGQEFKSIQLADKERSQLEKKYQLPQKFILYLGTLEPRKNLTTLIKSFNELSQEFSDYKLVLAGSWGWQSEDIKKHINQKIIIPGHIQEKDKVNLLNLAKLFVFPSLYEGFGMPPLEAMACGIPTIVSDQASLPEVVGDGAVKIRPHDQIALTRAMERILSSADHRNKLKRAGQQRAKLFDWQDTASKTLAVIKKYG